MIASRSIFASVLVVFSLCIPARAQPCEGVWLAGEVPAGLDAHSLENSSVAHANGDVILAGETLNPFLWDGDSWAPLPGDARPGNGVSALLELSEGGTVFGGRFYRFSPLAEYSHLVLWNGTDWIPYAQPGERLLTSTAIVANIGALAQMPGPGGELIVAGNFSTIGGVAAKSIAIGTDGQWQPLGEGFMYQGRETTVTAVVVLPDRSIVAGVPRSNSGVGTPARSPVQRWDGQEWSDMNPGAYGIVNAMAVRGERGLIVVGELGSVGQDFVHRVMYWNGAEWSTLGIANGSILSVLVLPNDRIMIGGFFTAIDGVTAVRSAVWNGESWAPAVVPVDGGVTSLSLLPDGRVFAAGGFTLLGELASSTAAIYDDENGEWRGTGWGPDAAIHALLPVGNDMIVGGVFTRVAGIPQQPVIRWDGAKWHSLGPVSVGGQVLALTQGESGEMVAAGRFGTLGGVSVNSIARWDGQAWSPLSSGAVDFVRAVAFLSDGRLVAGGDFFQIGGTPAGRIGVWDGTRWDGFSDGLNGAVQAVLATRDGGFIAGGQFNGSVTTPLAKIGHWDGTAWHPVGAGLSDAVNALAFDPNGDLIAGGLFLSAGGLPTNRIARWDGQTWAALGDGLNGEVRALAFDEAGALYVGGAFTSAGGVPAVGVARWDGSAWTGLADGVISGTVNALAFAASGELVVGGPFGRAAFDPRRFFARWSPTGIPWFVGQPTGATLGCGDSAAFSVELARGYLGTNLSWLKDGTPIPLTDPRFRVVESAGGSRLTITGLLASDAGVYTSQASNGCGTRVSQGASLTVRHLADFDNSGGVDGADVEAFFVLWESGESDADVNGDGGVDGSDVEVFLVAWEAGGCG